MYMAVDWNRDIFSPLYFAFLIIFNSFNIIFYYSHVYFYVAIRKMLQFLFRIKRCFFTFLIENTLHRNNILPN